MWSVGVTLTVVVEFSNETACTCQIGLPVKTETHPRGIFFESELVSKFRDIYESVSFLLALS